MQNFVDYIREFNTVTVVLRLILTLLLGGFIGYERQKNGHAAGFRTHILVCLGASMTIMTGIFCAEVLNFNSDPIRIGAQVISGIGFIGAGTIIMTDKKIKGLTTAAGLWSTAAIGLACGCGFYEGALLCAVIILIVMSQLKTIDRAIFNKRPVINVYIEVVGVMNINKVLDQLDEKKLTISSVNIRPPQSKQENNIGMECTVSYKFKSDKRDSTEKLLQKINEIDMIAFVIEMD